MLASALTSAMTSAALAAPAAAKAGIAAQEEPPSLRNWVTADGSSGYPAQPGRYHLYISLACPWASRAYSVLKLKGLDDVIGVTVTKPVWEKTRADESHTGWAFATEHDAKAGEGDMDPINGAHFVRDLYGLVDPRYTKVSVPILWDKEKKTIVNNESADLMRIFNSEFNEFAEHADLDLYPKALHPQIDETNEWVLSGINSGVYKCGSATTQSQYDKAIVDLYGALDRAESVLSQHRYLVGDTLTEADVRLFVSLIRFDEAYSVYFKCNKRLIREYPNLFNYVKDICQTGRMADTVNMWHIKQYHFRSHPEKNPGGIVPVGMNIDYRAPHDRYRFSQIKGA